MRENIVNHNIMPLPMNTHTTLHLYILYLYDVYFRIIVFSMHT